MVLNYPFSRYIFKTISFQFEDGINKVKNDNDINVLILKSAVPGVFCAGCCLIDCTIIIDL